MIVDKNSFIKYPSWNLAGHKIAHTDTLEILDAMFAPNIYAYASNIMWCPYEYVSFRAMYALALGRCSCRGSRHRSHGALEESHDATVFPV